MKLYVLSIAFFGLLLSSCSNWKEVAVVQLPPEIEKRFGFNFRDEELLNTAKTISGDSWMIKLKFSNRLIRQITNSPFKDSDIILTSSRLNNKFQWWDLSGRELHFFFLDNQKRDSISIWVDEKNDILYAKVLFREAF